VSDYFTHSLQALRALSPTDFPVRKMIFSYEKLVLEMATLLTLDWNRIFVFVELLGLHCFYGAPTATGRLTMLLQVELRDCD